MVEIFFIIIVPFLIAGGSLSNSLLLNEYPFIMSHDAASGYLRRDHVVANWTATQSDGLKEQLDCGSRGFDYRPYYFNDTIFAHHGSVKIPVPMSESILEIESWLRLNKNEFVILYVNKCEGQDGCKEAVLDLLDKFRIRTITDCSELSTLSVKAAKVSGQLPTGGSLIAVYDCMLEQYDDSITCYGANNEVGAYFCYDEATMQVPFQAISDYLDSATAVVPSDEGLLWMAQAHWQSSAESVVMGTLHQSSLLLDESLSGVNSWLARRIRDGAFNHLNAVEVLSLNVFYLSEVWNELMVTRWITSAMEGWICWLLFEKQP